jgi:hypothetical protein
VDETGSGDQVCFFFSFFFGYGGMLFELPELHFLSPPPELFIPFISKSMLGFWPI